ncbi:MAG: hypothetical protein M9959_06545 [Chitinophagaceae bacterium]|nr:hypothetical protein [Chitinophagaceae bacterium]
MSYPKKIETPEKMYSLWQEFKQWCADNPYTKNDFKTSREGVVEVVMKQQRPVTVAGFEGWLSERNIISHIGDYMANTNNFYNDFVEVMQRIKSENKAGLLSGALAHVYNPNLTSAYLRIPKVVETKNTIETPSTVTDLNPEQLEALKGIIDDKFNQQ